MATPTKEELATLQALKTTITPPSQTEAADLDKIYKQQNTPTPATPGMLESAARGAEQGATFGFGDEINGGLEALLNGVTGKDKGLSILDAYKQHRDESRAAMDAASAVHPYLYGAGNVAGALGAGLLTAGVGGLAGAAPLAEQGLAGAAKAGAAYGALSGLGDTKDITDVGQTAKDVAGNALAGAAIAPVANVAGKSFLNGLETLGGGVKGFAKDVAGNDIVANPFRSFRQGLDGTKITGETGKEASKQLSNNTLNGVKQSIQDSMTGLVNQRTNLLTQAGELPAQGYSQFVEPAEQALANAAKEYPSSKGVQEIQQLINDTFYSRVPGEQGIQLVAKPSISYNKLQEFRTSLGNMGNGEFAEGLNDKVGEAVASRLLTPLDRSASNLEQTLNLPEDVVPLKTFMGSESSPGYVPGLQDINDKLSPLKQALDTVPNSEPAQAAGALSKFLDAYKANPKLMDTVSNDQLSQISKAMQVDKLVTAANQKGLTTLPIKAAPTIVGNFLGRTTKVLSDATPEQLKQIGSGLATRASDLGGAAVNLGNILTQAADRDTAGRNALFFTIEQNPAYRDILRKVTQSSEPEKQ